MNDKMIVSLWNSTGISAALKVKKRISRHQDYTRSCSKMSVPLFNRGLILWGESFISLPALCVNCPVYKCKALKGNGPISTYVSPYIDKSIKITLSTQGTICTIVGIERRHEIHRAEIKINPCYQSRAKINVRIMWDVMYLRHQWNNTHWSLHHIFTWTTVAYR